VNGTSSNYGTWIGTCIALGHNTQIGNLTITGGDITAAGSKRGPRIGPGLAQTQFSIIGCVTITNGTIRAKKAGSSDRHWGYLNGRVSRVDSVTITGADINATDMAYGAGIGAWRAVNGNWTVGCLTIVNGQIRDS
jgi:hypothetical protein